MAVTLGQLRYRIEATDTGFRQTIQNVSARLDSLHQRVRAGLSVWRSWSLAITAAGTAAAIALRRISDETARTAVMVDRFSKQTGIATAQIQALGYAASQEHASLEILGQALVRLTRRTAEAAAGNRAYADSFRRMGIEIRNADGTIRRTDEILLDIVSAFEGIADEGERARIAFNLMGDAGYALLPFLSLGRQEIERLMQEARDLGIIIASENIQRFVQYDAVMTRWRATLTGLRNDIAIATIPVFNVLMDRVVDGVRWFGEWIRENRVFVAQMTLATGGVMAFVFGLRLLTSGITVAIRGLGLLATILGFLTSPIGLVITTLGLLYVAWEKNWLGIQDKTQAAVDFIRDQWDRLVQWWDSTTIGKAINEWWEKVQEVWDDETLTLKEKTIETLNLIPGVNLLKDFAQKVAEIWTDEDIPFGEKVIETLNLIPGIRSLVAFAQKVAAIWDDETIPFEQKVIETLNLVPGYNALKDFIDKVRAIWDDETLTLKEKTIETFRLIPGVAWLQDFINRIQKEWEDAGDLPLGEKLARIARLIPGVDAIDKLIDEIREIWARKDLNLGQKVVETFKVIAERVDLEAEDVAIALGAAITLPYILQKLADALRLVPGIIAVLNRGNVLKLTIAGVTLALGIGLWEFANEDPEARQNILNRINEILQELLPDPIAVPLGATIRFTLELTGRLYDAIRTGFQTGDWSEVFGVAADIWRAGATLWVSLQLASQSFTAILNAIRTGLGLLPVASFTGLLTTRNLVGIMSVGVAFIQAMQEGDWVSFAADAVAALLAGFAAAGLTGNLNAGVLVFTIAFNLRLGSRIMDEVREFVEGVRNIGTEEGQISRLETEARMIEARLRGEQGLVGDVEREILQNRLTEIESEIRRLRDAGDETRAVMEDLGESFRNTAMAAGAADSRLADLGRQYVHISGESERAAVVVREFQEALQEQSREIAQSMSVSDLVVNSIIAGNPHLRQHRDILLDMARRLVEIGEAKGAPLTFQELAEVMALLLSESSTVLDNMEAMENPLRVTSAGFAELNRQGIELVNTTDGLNRNLEAGLELFRAYKREFGDPSLAAGAYLFPSFARRGEWDRPFMGGGDVTGMTAAEKARRYSIILDSILQGMQEGGIVPDMPISGDWFPALLSSEEAVIPASVWKKGILAIAEWFRKHGVPGFQQGRPPEVPITFDVTAFEEEERRLAEIDVQVRAQTRSILSIFRDLFVRLFTAIRQVIRENYPELAEFIDRLEADIIAALNAVDEQIEEMFELMTTGFNNVNAIAQQWTEQFIRSLSDAIAYGRDLYDVFDNFLRMLASRFIETRILTPLLGRIFPDILSGLPLFHSGGLVLGGGYGALVMHNGGIIPGLRPDERLIVAQTGERVLSRMQNVLFERMISEDDNREDRAPVNVNMVIQAVDAASFAELVRRNPEAVKVVVINDVLNNGEIRRVIQTVARGG